MTIKNIKKIERTALKIKKACYTTISTSFLVLMLLITFSTQIEQTVDSSSNKTKIKGNKKNLIQKKEPATKAPAFIAQKK